MKNFIQSGQKMTFIAAADVESGEPVVIGDFTGISSGKYATGEEGEMQLTGVYELAKEAALAIAHGDVVYWDGSAKEVDKTNTNDALGVAFKAAAGADTSVIVLMKGGSAAFN